MKIVVVMDGRFEWHEHKPYSSHMAYHPFAERFLQVFDEVVICARAYDVPVASGAPITGRGAGFLRIGDYRGAKAFLRQLPGMLKDLWRLSGTPGPALAYLPGTIPLIFGLMRLMRRRPLYSLIVADPNDQLGTGTLDHPLRPLARCVFVNVLRLLARHSKAAMYVTREYLQQRYPLKRGASFATSDVYIPPEAYKSKSRGRDTFAHSPKTLIYVAMMAQGYKGHDDLIEVFAQARRAVADLRLVLVGDGPLRPQIEALADRAGVRDAVHFAGKLGHGQAMTSQLDAADLFVMPSRAEGLPRALVEAMARGLPALSTDVGGIPELLPPDCLVPANDPTTFARRLVEIIDDPDRLSAMSEINLQTSRDYSVDKVTGRMIKFYRHILEEASRES